MNPSLEHYRQDFADFVTTKLTDFYDGIAQFYRERGGNPDSLSYFVNHWPRFEGMLKLCNDNHIDPVTINTACELGSWYPYTSYCWKAANSACTIDLYDIIVRELKGQVAEYDVEGVRLIDFNLCTDTLPAKKYDIVVVSEVLEHLSCNVMALCDDIKLLVRPGGHLLVTYPLGGKHARDYGAEMPGYDQTRLVEGHVREFTRQTVPLFFKDMTLVATRDVRYPAYGLIQICLYRR